MTGRQASHETNGGMKSLQELVRPNIWALEPYSCARDEFKGKAARVFLDANESPYNSPWNRYPDPLQEAVKERLARIKSVRPTQIFLGNGSDEAIDLAYRVFCEPRVDNVVAIAPTYGMYKVCADINDVEYREVKLDEHFRLDAQNVLDAVNAYTKLIWLCTPNNPTGNDLDRGAVRRILEEFDGVVVIDEAYSDFSPLPPLRLSLDRFPNMLALNTFSKAWGCAGIRLGMAFASEEIIALLNKVKYPYNVNKMTQDKAMEMLAEQDTIARQVGQICREREHMVPALRELPICLGVYPSSANFLLVKMTDADAVYRYLVDKGVIVRNRNKVALCGGCLRITIGTKQENNELLAALRQYKL